MELMDLPRNIYRTSVNFMGCYAAIHALKMADMICKSAPEAKVLIVSTELCTLHLQKEPTPDNLSSGLLFGDGSAAVLVVGDHHSSPGPRIRGFYAEVVPKGKKDMAWELSSTGFQMTLSGYIPDLIREDIRPLVERALQGSGCRPITQWCIHPGGKKILEAIEKSLCITPDQTRHSHHVLSEYGNMSSATILFVLREMLQQIKRGDTVFSVGFGPGLTMESMILEA
jgi:predicted naringenin-chalcone synthase